MICVLNFPCPSLLLSPLKVLNLLLNSYNGNDAKQRVFLGRLLVALKRAGFSLADVQSDVLSPPLTNSFVDDDVL